MTLDVLIATHTPAGIDRVERMNLPRLDGVRYIVSWQSHGDAPIPTGLAGRNDVEIHRFGGTGLSRNRNNAIDFSKGDLMLMADDDVVYTPEGLLSVISAFEERPGMEMASFMYEGADRKQYPPAECDLARLPKGYYQSAIEIAVSHRGRAGQIRFIPEFGLGSGRWTVGDDAMFLLTARRMGIIPRFIPRVICRHEGLSTGSRPHTDSKALRGQGACIALEYPVTSLLRIPLKAWREWRAGRTPLLSGLAGMLAGAFDATFHFTPPWKD
ncbi:MAG: glycosyltransferase [Muribaculaceae bacterium]|nr:glycosyltransferase [Muribaculaceae bacterium]